ncbi:MAG: hypothetical protein HQM10_27265 [Candidatus Riflebacteria bacterium]|nr:hypothetical protein [Candidatus Riflebacteria bacterium]
MKLPPELALGHELCYESYIGNYTLVELFFAKNLSECQKLFKEDTKCLSDNIFVEGRAMICFSEQFDPPFCRHAPAACGR